MNSNIKTTGLNGFGRFGLHFLKYWLDRKHTSNFILEYINDDYLKIKDIKEIILTDPYVKFDDYNLDVVSNKLIFEKEKKIIEIIITNNKSNEIVWIGSPDFFLECSGKNSTLDECLIFLKDKTKNVFISSTSWDANQTIIYGYNENDLNLKNKVISYGSCTVNAYVPLSNYINNTYQINNSDVNVIHNVQHYNLAKSNTLYRKFCTLQKSGPNLLNFLNDKNFKVNYTLVPYSGVSIIDLRYSVRNKVDIDTFISNLTHEIEKSSLNGLYEIQEKDLGPEVHECSTSSAIIIKENIDIIDNNIYLHCYFDNENSVNRYYDLLQYSSLKL